MTHSLFPYVPSMRYSTFVSDTGLHFELERDFIKRLEDARSPADCIEVKVAFQGSRNFAEFRVAIINFKEKFSVMIERLDLYDHGKLHDVCIDETIKALNIMGEFYAEIRTTLHLRDKHNVAPRAEVGVRLMDITGNQSLNMVYQTVSDRRYLLTPDILSKRLARLTEEDFNEKSYGLLIRLDSSEETFFIEFFMGGLGEVGFEYRNTTPLRSQIPASLMAWLSLATIQANKWRTNERLSLQS